MKKLGPAQYGLMILVVMVFIRAFIAGDQPIGDLINKTVQPLAQSLDNTNINYGEVSFPLLGTASYLHIDGYSDHLPDEFQQTSGTVESNLSIAQNNSENDEIHTGEEDLATPEGVGLDDESEAPEELAIFTPSFGKNQPDNKMNDLYDDVAPLDNGNTITDQMNRLFPINAPN